MVPPSTDERRHRRRQLAWAMVIQAGRRAVDIIVAGGGLICLGPLIAVIALVVYADVGRPIFFSQMRLGKQGQRFRLHKFRKFGCAPGAKGLPLTLKNDPRLSTSGRILERTKLDELPQLWNVLVGEMSLVGPRPEALDFADCFRGEYQNVLKFQPGIFGPSQVMFRNENLLFQGVANPEQFYRKVLFPLKARADLSYYLHRTLICDVKWLLLGIAAVARRPRVSMGFGGIERAEQWIRREEEKRRELRKGSSMHRV